MQIEDLKIGSVVTFKNRDDFYAKIISLSSLNSVEIERFFTDGASDVHLETVNDLTGYKITSDDLERLGFTAGYGSDKHGKWSYYKLINDRIYFLKKDKVSGEISLFNKKEFITNVPYFHELQNAIYFIEKYFISFGCD